MEISFKKNFIKDFEKLPEVIKNKTREICFDIFPKIKKLSEFDRYPFKKMKGYNLYYRIKVGEFRIGFREDNGKIKFMRVLNRKDIYRHFP